MPPTYDYPEKSLAPRKGRGLRWTIEKHWGPLVLCVSLINVSYLNLSPPILPLINRRGQRVASKGMDASLSVGLWSS